MSFNRQKVIRVALVSLIAFLFVALGQSARLGSWAVLGPGGGGAQFTPTISPHSPSRVLVSCDMTGSYVSDDGGGSWRMFNLRGRTRFFEFDPSLPDTIYAQGIGLWRTTDAGTKWNLVYPVPASVTGISMPDDHSGERIVTATGPAAVITALAIDPADSRTLIAAFSPGRAMTQLRISSDHGESWTTLHEFSGRVRRIYIDPRSPADDRTIYAILANSVATREKRRWQEGPPAPGIDMFTDVAAGFLPGAGKLVVYGVAPASWKNGTLSGGIFVTEDGGETWRQANADFVARMKLPAPEPRFTAVATSLKHANVAYVSVGRVSIDQGVSSLGVLKTSDCGRSWQFVWRESEAKSPDVDDGWISARFGPGWGDHPLSLGVSPTNPDLCYGTDYGRTLRSADGGRTWKAVYTRRANGGWTTTGLDVTTCYGVHFDPFDPKRIFISYTDIGLFLSENGGASWTSATVDGVPRPWVNTTYWVEFDPDVKGRMWAVMSGTHDLPRPKMWRRISPSGYRGGVCRSDDGGRTWTATTEGMPQTAATHILMDRRSHANARVLYVTGFGRGVFKSSDGGASWTLKNNGLPAKEPFAWRMAQDRDGVLYLIIARRSDDGSIGNELDGGLYRSRDGAETWQRITLPEGVNGPNGLAIDPRDPRRLYLAAWRRDTHDATAGGGVYLSADAGSTWRPVLSADQHVYDVTVDPRNPDILYACGFESSAWRTTDRGETWRRLRGYNFKWGHRVIPDPLRPDRIYITTFGGSVWHGPATGDPSAMEDIATPQLRLTR